MLAVQNHIISCSLDGTIKVWNAIEPASPGAVLDVNAAYVFPPEEPGKPVRPCCLVLSLSMQITCAGKIASSIQAIESYHNVCCKSYCVMLAGNHNEAVAEMPVALPLLWWP